MAVSWSQLTKDHLLLTKLITRFPFFLTWNKIIWRVMRQSLFWSFTKHRFPSLFLRSVIESKIWWVCGLGGQRSCSGSGTWLTKKCKIYSCSAQRHPTQLEMLSLLCTALLKARPQASRKQSQTPISAVRTFTEQQQQQQQQQQT